MSLQRTQPRKMNRALLLLFLAVCSLAQNTPKDLADASLEELSSIQVFSASKHLQSAADAPAAVTIVTSEDIQKYGYRTLADILRTVRGFYITNDRNYSYIGVRGFGRPGDYNTRILLLVDGHRLNNNVYDEAMVGTEFPLDVDLIDRVEVIRGPASSLYGSNALFAVINVITKRADQIRGPELSFETGSYGTYKGRASYGTKLKDLDALGSLSFYDSAGQILFFPTYDQPGTNNGTVRNHDYDRYFDALVTLSWQNIRLQALDSSRDKGLPTAPYGTIFNDPRTHTIDGHQFLDLSSERRVGAALINLRTYYDRYAYDAYWAFSSGLNRDYTRRQRWGTELQLSRTILQKHRL